MHVFLSYSKIPNLPRIQSTGVQLVLQGHFVNHDENAVCSTTEHGADFILLALCFQPDRYRVFKVNTNYAINLQL